LRLKKVLVVHKKSTFQIQAEEHKEARFLKLVSDGSKVVNRVRLAHEEHVDSLAKVEAELTKRGVQFQSLWRSQLPEVVEDVDLVISVGGDGTFLDASHALLDVPALGVNSSRSSNGDSIGAVLDQIESDASKPIDILRLEVLINGERVKELVLNEVLLAHSSPAATSRYLIARGDMQEEHRSSGVWVSTPAGSTGSLRSAGGKILPIPLRQFEYLVREPCIRPGEVWRLLGGVLDDSQELKIVSQMRTGEVYIDGPHIIRPVNLGDELVIRPSKHSLRAFIKPDVNDVFLQ
jgi:NAD+ kinase